MQVHVCICWTHKCERQIFRSRRKLQRGLELVQVGSKRFTATRSRESLVQVRIPSSIHIRALIHTCIHIHVHIHIHSHTWRTKCASQTSTSTCMHSRSRLLYLASAFYGVHHSQIDTFLIHFFSLHTHTLNLHTHVNSFHPSSHVHTFLIHFLNSQTHVNSVHPSSHVHTFIQSRKGLARMRTGNLELAKEDFKEALKHEPGNKDVRREMDQLKTLEKEDCEFFLVF